MHFNRSGGRQRDKRLKTKPAKFNSPLALRLSEEIGPEGVSESRSDKISYARDLWPLDTIRVRDGAVSPYPDVILRPADEEHILKILKTARELNVPVIPYGAGSGVCGGTVAIHGGVILDLKGMNRILSIDEKSHVAEIEAGIVGEIMERELNRRGYTVGHFPSSIYCSTLGGWLATRSAGQLSAKYGKIEDRVLSLRAILSNGDIIETVKSPRSATGPDWTQAMVGSEGAYGIITRATLKLSPNPEAREFHAFHFQDIHTAIDAVRRIFQGGVKPAVCRLYDPVDTLIAGSGKSAVTQGPKHKGILGRVIEGLHRAPFDIPREVLPRLVAKPRLLNHLLRKRAAKCRLILTFEGPTELVKIEHDRTVKFCMECKGEDLGPGPAQKWWGHRYAVSYGLSTIFDLGLFADTMEVATSWSNLENLYNKVSEAIIPHAFLMAHFSHAYPQGCSIYFTFAAGDGDSTGLKRKYRHIWNEGLNAAVKAGGAISHHHGIGILKQHFLEHEHGEAIKIIKALKSAFDPDSILNPGKLGV